ncbi:AAA family ATPase [Candidatus Woesearchaeota archaeon]|nr:AAA family ATPase [Candidatus Woesearchaeota archaeon]
MDEDNQKYRRGQPSQEETERIQNYLNKQISITMHKINRTLKPYGLMITNMGTLLPIDWTNKYPVFQGFPEEQPKEKPSDLKEGLDKIIEKGAKGLKEELDKYVIGQDKAKKTLAVEIINHYRKINSDDDHKFSRKKRNILLIGNTGVGKTYLIERIAEELKVPFAKVTATDYTSAGYVGGDVDDIIRQNLLRNANGDTARAEIGIVYIDEIDKISASTMSTGPDVGGDKVQSAILTLIDGKEVELVAPHDQCGKRDIMERKKAGEKVQETINTKNILFILGGSFSAGKNGRSLLECIEERKCKESQKPEQTPIGFMACLDKQEKLEDYKDVEVKSQDLVAYGMRHEMIGRIPAKALLQDLSVEDLYRILKKETEDSLVEQAKTEFRALGIELKFEDDALRAIAEKSDLKTGARGLETVMSDTLGEYLFELEGKGLKPLVITKETVEDPQGELQKLIKNSERKKSPRKVYYPQEDVLKTEPSV